MGPVSNALCLFSSPSLCACVFQYLPYPINLDLFVTCVSSVGEGALGIWWLELFLVGGGAKGFQVSRAFFKNAITC